MLINQDTEQDYAWVIVKDNIADVEITPPSNLNAVGMIGPHWAKYDADYIKKHGARFRMSDDDGEIYYYGYIVGDYEGFEPLDDFGLPNAGCAHIEYKNPQTKEYEEL